MIVRTLARTKLVAVASPGYVKDRGTPSTVRELARHACLMGFTRNGIPESYWPLRNGGQVHVEGSLFCNDGWLLREAALRGSGIALLPSVIVEQAVSNNELVFVLPNVLGADQQLGIVYLEKEFVPATVRASFALYNTRADIDALCSALDRAREIFGP